MTNPQNGRSMIEMLGVLAIIAVLTIGGIAGYSKAMKKWRINKTIDEISMIATNIRTIFINEKTYGGLGCEDASRQNSQNFARMGIITPNMLTDTPIMGNDGVNTYIKNLFNGGIWIGANIDDGWLHKQNIHEKAFIIAYSGLDKDSCMELATKDWNNIGIYVLTINGNDGDYVNGADECTNNCFLLQDNDRFLYATKDYIPISPSVAAKPCSICDTLYSGCNIMFGFRD